MWIKIDDKEYGEIPDGHLIPIWIKNEKFNSEFMIFGYFFQNEWHVYSLISPTHFTNMKNIYKNFEVIAWYFVPLYKSEM